MDTATFPLVFGFLTFWLYLSINAQSTTETDVSFKCSSYMPSFSFFSSLASKDCYWCYGKYGCLQIGGPFISLNHLIGLQPQSPSVLNVLLQLYTRNNSETPFVFAPDAIHQLLDSNFDLSSDTKFIIGGFFGGDSGIFGQLTKKALFKHDKNYNVIIVNWLYGSETTYSQAVANTRIVGRLVAYFIESLRNETGYPYSKCHLIGHSLGSHVSGYAGELLSGLGRISGLDPAGPYFQNTPPAVRLDPSDADFVDVIHSFAGVFGIDQQVGHLDFYPNGGSIQPACAPGVAEANFDDPLILITCNHLMAKVYFRKSIQDSPNCTYIGYACDSYDDFQAGLCSNCTLNKSPNCAKMGFYSDQYKAAGYPLPAPKKFYLNTNSVKPFCQI